jgi:hypothetical protein
VVVWQLQEAQALQLRHQQLLLVILVDPCLCLLQPSQACAPCCQRVWEPWASWLVVVTLTLFLLAQPALLLHLYVQQPLLLSLLPRHCQHLRLQCRESGGVVQLLQRAPAGVTGHV